MSFRKHCQLQIRVSPQEKEAIRRAAERAGLPMSGYILKRLLSAPGQEFQRRAADLLNASAPAFVLAALNSLLARLTASELPEAVATAPEAALPPFLANYVAAMVEMACHEKSVPAPAWVREVKPLEKPAFGSDLRSLRLHLLTHSPAPFRRRNIFIDSSVGDQV